MRMEKVKYMTDHYEQWAYDNSFLNAAAATDLTVFVESQVSVSLYLGGKCTLAHIASQEEAYWTWKHTGVSKGSLAFVSGDVSD